MRITRRTGGGRGDYEISEDAGSLTPYDLVDHRIELSLGPQIDFDTGVMIRHRNGKFRLRTEGVPLHVHRQVAAALLMPHPIRANPALGSGIPVLRRNKYAVQHIVFDPELDISEGVAHAGIATIIIRNSDHPNVEIDVLDRVKEIEYVWNDLSKFPDPQFEIF